MLSKFSPLIWGVYFFTSTFLAKEPSIPSINKANAKKKKANGKSFCIEARRARKPNKTPLTVKRCIK